jgi:hypothetical protein
MALLGILAIIVGIGSLVCWILTLIKIFKAGEIVHGIIGIICPLWAFIYGWMKATAYNHKNVMMIWSVLIVINIVLNIILRAGA